MRRTAIIMLTLLLTAGTAAAEIYHYVDDDGNHHFSTYRQRGMELVEVIGGDSARATSTTRSSSRSTSSRRRHYDHDAFDDIIRAASEEFEIPFEFIKAVIKVESAFNPRAVSRVGAQGLMQLMPRTAEGLEVEDSFDPRQNIMGGTELLRNLSDRYNGDINLVLSGYNAGPGAVAQHDGIPYEATRRYIQSVYRYYQEYLDASE
jgi:soluble lytic murein transglycosylase-like protein